MELYTLFPDLTLRGLMNFLPAMETCGESLVHVLKALKPANNGGMSICPIWVRLAAMMRNSRKRGRMDIF